MIFSIITFYHPRVDRTHGNAHTHMMTRDIQSFVYRIHLYIICYCLCRNPDDEVTHERRLSRNTSDTTYEFNHRHYGPRSPTVHQTRTHSYAYPCVWCTHIIPTDLSPGMGVRRYTPRCVFDLPTARRPTVVTTISATYTAAMLLLRRRQ